MKYKFFFLVIFAAILAGPVSVDASNSILVPVDGVLDLSGMDEMDVLELQGNWRLYPRQFVSPDKINSETDYILINVPDTWESSIYKGSYLNPQTYATYYLKIILPENTDVFSLYIPDISSSYKLFINKKFIIQKGTPSYTPENEVGEWNPTVITYTPKSNVIELVLHVSNFHHNDGGMWENIKIGPVEKIYFIRILGLIRGILLSGILLAFAFYFINFYSVVKPRNRSVLYLALACILGFIRVFITKDVPLQFLYDDFPFEIQVALEYITLCSMSIVLTEYVLYNFNSNKYLKYIKRILDIILCTIIGIIIFSPMVFYTSLVVPIQITVIANLLLILAVTTLAMFHHNREAIILFAGSLFLLIFSSMEMAFINRFFTKSIIFNMGITVFILFLLLLIHLHNRLTNKAFSEASKSKDMEVAFLRAQIVPHFVNNALSNAIYLIENKPYQAKEFLIELSNLMVNKYNFNLKDSVHEIPLSKEIDIIHSYIYIQNIRFNNKITYIEEVDERAMSIMVPPLLIQPLVENAITHGLSNSDKPTSELTLKISLDKDFVNIIVEDNGTGINAQKLILLESPKYEESKGVGIRNIKERLKNMKGSSFSISSKLGVKTTVMIKIKTVCRPPFVT